MIQCYVEILFISRNKVREAEDGANKLQSAYFCSFLISGAWLSFECRIMLVSIISIM